MYSEPFKFCIEDSVAHSERMMLLSEMFKIASKDKIDPVNFCGYCIKQNGMVTFSSSHPTLTNTIENWLIQKEKEGVIKRIKPRWPDE